MNHRLAILIAVLAALVPGARVVHSATSTFRQAVDGYAGNVDTHIRLDQPTSHFGGATNVLIDNDNPIAHGLIRFDNIFGYGPGQIPLNNALIYSARLILLTSNDGDAVWFHRMLVPWQETNNWNDLSMSGPGLQADNIEMSGTPDFSFIAATPIPRVDSFDVTATVQGWYSGEFPNYGWGITSQFANGWQFNSSEHGVVNNRPLLEISWNIGEPVPRITRHPASSTNAEGSTVVLFVEISGTDPSYQWFKDGVPLTGVTNATYTIPVVRRADAGTYWVYVSSPIGETTSNSAILTVIPDETPPSLLCAYGTNSLATIFVEFSEIVTNTADPALYRLLPAAGGDSLTIINATHSSGEPEGKGVVLALDSATPLQSGVSYALTVDPVSDRLGNQSSTQQTAVALYVKPIFAISEAQIWKYNDSGNDLSNSWKDVSFDDSSWPSGLPLFGFETAPLPEPLRTPLSLTNGFGNRIITYYFRTRFDSSTSGVLRFRTVLDDAAAIYLNGTEIYRIRLPAGPLDYMTGGAGAAVNNAVYEGPFNVCVTNLAAGDNVLAVEVHQTSANSSDLVFGMELSAMSPHPPPQLRIALSADGSEVVLTWNGSAPLEQTANLNPSDWAQVQGAVSGYRTPRAGTMFFRLREP